MANPAAVDIGSESYWAYLDDEEADIYMGAAFHGANYNAATEANKRIALVTATRILDRQSWKGDQTDPDTPQPLQWPRSNTGVDGVEDDVVPAKIVQATAETALALLDGSDVQTAQNQAQKIQMLKAGSVALQYFRGAEGAPLRFPLIVQELVRDYLSGGNGVSLTGLATGTGGESVTGLDFGLLRPL